MSIRLRVAAVFTLALAIAFALGGWLFIREISRQLLRNTDQALAAQLGTASQFMPVKGEEGTTNPPAVVPIGEYLIQVINPAGQVFGNSPDASKTVPMLNQAEIQQARTGKVKVTQLQDEEAVRLVAAPYPGRPGWVAVAGISLDTENGAVGHFTTLLLIGGGALVLVGGFGAYWLARAALSPVERLRREVAALSARDTEASVRVPRTRDEIAALAGTMNDMLDRLHGALARQRGFVADASHELRTPLAVLGVELELAGRPGRSRDELAEALANASEEVGRLTRITNDLLVLARSDEDQMEVRPEPSDIRELLQRSADLAGARAGKVGVTCVVSAPCGLIAAVDADKIRQAVDNLVSNALRFAPRDTEVTISGQAAGGDLVIEVADSGPGFPADFLPQAFERFRRPDDVRASSEGGAGLGLAIVRAIAVAHGGQAAARNRPTGGAMVSIELPGVLLSR